MKARQILIIGLIIFLAAVLRLYQLGKIPAGLDWDEASIGWNAYSILMTGTDEYGVSHPVSIRSFNDYKPPMYIYATVPSVALFGLSEWAVRLPSAVAGTLLVLITYYLVVELLSKEGIPRIDIRSTRIRTALISSLLVAISPWSLQFSRVAFEANLALFFFAAGVTCLVYFLRRKVSFWLLISAVSFVFSIYSYHSSRVAAPLFILGVGIYFWKTFAQHWKESTIAVILAGMLLVPLAVDTLKNGSLQSRFGEVSIFSASGLNDIARTTLVREADLSKIDREKGDLIGKAAHNKYLTLGKIFAKDYLDHLNFDFLFLSGDGNPRHHAPDVGLLLLWELAFVLLGGYFLVSRRFPGWFIVAWWFLSAPVAAALTSQTPHAVRSLLFLPTFQVLGALGLIWFFRSFKFFKILKVLSFLVTAGFFLNLFYFFHQYFVHMNLEAADSWQFGYKEAVSYVNSQAGKYNRIYVSTSYDQPYIYFLFYGNSDPGLKNPGNFSQGFGKYVFIDPRNFISEQKNGGKRDNFGDALFVMASADGLKLRRVLDEIYYPNGRSAFVIGTNPVL